MSSLTLPKWFGRKKSKDKKSIDDDNKAKEDLRPKDGEPIDAFGEVKTAVVSHPDYENVLVFASKETDSEGIYYNLNDIRAHHWQNKSLSGGHGHVNSATSLDTVAHAKARLRKAKSVDVLGKMAAEAAAVGRARTDVSELAPHGPVGAERAQQRHRLSVVPLDDPLYSNLSDCTTRTPTPTSSQPQQRKKGSTSSWGISSGGEDSVFERSSSAVPQQQLPQPPSCAELPVDDDTSWEKNTSFSGNHYGTPKPSEESSSSGSLLIRHAHSGGHAHPSNNNNQFPAPSLSSSSSRSEAVLSGAHPSSEGKRRRNRSNVEAMTAKHFSSEEQHAAAAASNSATAATELRLKDQDSNNQFLGGGRRKDSSGNNGNAVIMPDGGKDENHANGGPDTPSGSSKSSSNGMNGTSAAVDSGHPESPDVPDQPTSSSDAPTSSSSHAPNAVMPPTSEPPPATEGSSEDPLGPLPPNWEKAYTDKGEAYFIDHNSGTSHWLDPRLSRVQKKRPEECEEGELPFGWERIDDPHYGTYFIDHVNRRTQYENPVLVAKSGAPGPSSESSTAGPYYPPEGGIGRQQPPQPPYLQPGQGTFPRNGGNNNAKKTTSPFFTRDPSQLRGERLRCQLVKSSRGLGFTIVGGDDNVEEFLQIKSVVPNGPAWADGGLKTGDVLVYVNDTCVLGFTHADMVTMFQSIATNELVTLEVCRGYPLPFDPDDPNTEIVTTVAVTSPEQGDWASELERQRVQGGYPPGQAGDVQSMPDLSAGPQQMMMGQRPGSADLLGQGEASDFSSEVKNALSSSNAGNSNDLMTIPITKGGVGFGFTIADSGFGQKVKKILDRPRCKNLQEGDVLIEINTTTVRGMSHSDVVQVLKECPRGAEANITIQRGLLPTGGSGSSPSKSKYKKSKDDLLKPKSGFLFRSKTPTADMYSAQEKEKVPIRPKTPLVDTRNMGRSKTPTSLAGGQGGQTVQPSPFQRNDMTRASLGVGGGGYNQSAGGAQNQQQQGGYNMYGLNDAMGGMNLQQGRDRSPGKDMDPAGTGFYHPGYQPQEYPGGYQPDQQQQLQQQQQPMYNGYGDYQTDYSQQGGVMHSPSAGQGGNFYANGGYPQQQQQYDPTYGYTQQPPQQRSVPSGSYRAGSLPRTNPGQVAASSTAAAGAVRKESTSFEHSEPLPGNLTRWPRPERRPTECIDLTVTLHRQDSGFGFRIVGGTEEGSQVSIGHIVPGGAADVDGRLYSGDEIIAVDGSPVLNTSHHEVVSFMGQAAQTGRVTLTIRRRLYQQEYGRGGSAAPETYPYDVTVTRLENEGFGFVIISSVTRAGSTIGRIISGSPAERCGRLHIGDRILAVNHVDINSLHHGDIVNLIKDSGYSVVLTVGPPIDDTSSTASTSHRSSTSSMVTAQALPTVLPPSDSAGSTISHLSQQQQQQQFQHSVPQQQQQQIHNATTNDPSRSASVVGFSSNNNSHYQQQQFQQQYPQQQQQQQQVPAQGNFYNSYNNGNGGAPYKGLTVQQPADNYMQEDQELNFIEMDEQYYAVELSRGSRGFGFSIRGGREFHSMPLFVLRIAADGPAASDGRLRVGDQIIEINGINTKEMTHSEAIELIKSGGTVVRLLVKRGKMPPAALMEQVGLSPLSPTPTVSSSNMLMGGAHRPMSALAQPVTSTSAAHLHNTSNNNFNSSSSLQPNNNYANGYLANASSSSALRGAPQPSTVANNGAMGVPTPFTQTSLPNGHPPMQQQQPMGMEQQQGPAAGQGQYYWSNNQYPQH